MEKALYFKNRLEWRKWLTENYSSQQEVWLVHYKKHSHKSSINLDDAVQEAICFGWIDSKLISIDEEKFILKYTPRKVNSIWSKINTERAEKLIESGKMTDAGLVKIEEAKKRGFWNTAYTNKKKDRIPPDLKEALREDKNAWINFQQFANSYRNTYIGWVSGAKTETTRVKRITEVVKRSALNKKPGIE
jgi:uncharacterized protein YdeI (YjbR/CyaY-like superfamily)